MDGKKIKITAPIQPFDVTYGEFMNMYDNMPYVRNVALCSDDMVRKESGNIVKFYRCALKEACKIGGDKPLNSSQPQLTIKI